MIDLLGLLIFLRLEPFVSRPHLWSSLLSDHQQSFQSIFKQLALRHTKQFVRDELRLPVQQRYVITMPFTPIEEQHYQSLFQQMCEDCGLDRQGNPLRDDWDPEEHRVVEQMRTWLIRLRQTALHPDVGGRNRRAFGHKQGPLRTVDDVLAAMLEQSEISLRFDQRALLLSKLKRGQTFENSPEVKRALNIWTEVLHEANCLVTECRQQLQSEILVGCADGKVADSSSDTSDISETDNQGSKEKER
jgi:E3 ubiquitin-protein ligase SHPRH